MPYCVDKVNANLEKINAKERFKWEVFLLVILIPASLSFAAMKYGSTNLSKDDSETYNACFVGFTIAASCICDMLGYESRKNNTGVDGG